MVLLVAHSEPGGGVADREKPRRRRWPWVAGIVVVVLAVLAWGVRYVWLPSYRPHLDAGESYGVDVSSHRGRIDWTKVAADSIDFAYVKATEGGDFVDPAFADNWAGAAAAGVQRGAYRFFTLCSPGATQAQNFLRTVPDDAQDLAPAVDLELAGNCAARPERSAVQTELTAFLDAVEAVTHQPTPVYLRSDFEDRYHLRDALDRPLWQFRFLRRPAGDWAVWQVDGQSHIDGVAGNVDLDVMRPTHT
jgi:lysozyme